MSYYNISKDEMHEFLTALGFQPMNLPNVVELVYGRIVRMNNYKLSLRIYTAINPSGESRKIGTDAIRLRLFMMLDGQPTAVGKQFRCLRVTTWRKNVSSAIQSVANNLRFCADCGSPMVWRDKKDFWGCVRWHQSGCKGKPIHDPNKPTALPTSFTTKPKVKKEPKAEPKFESCHDYSDEMPWDIDAENEGDL